MKFEIEASPFIKMIKLVCESMAPEESSLNLIASEGHVRAASKALAAEMDAAVSEEGRCFLARSSCLKVLRRAPRRGNLTFEAGKRAVHLGNQTLTLSSRGWHSHSSPPPHVYFATSWGMIEPPDRPSRPS